MSDEQGAAQPEQTFNIRKIYLKDLSFESPQAPGVFQQRSEERRLGQECSDELVSVTLEQSTYD